MTAVFSVDERDWQGVDETPTFGSNNLVNSNGVRKSIDKSKIKSIDENTVTNELLVCDNSGNVIAKIDVSGIKSVDFLDKNANSFAAIANIVSAKLNDPATGEDFDDPTEIKRAKLTTVGSILDSLDTSPIAGSSKGVTSNGVFEDIGNKFVPLAIKVFGNIALHKSQKYAVYNVNTGYIYKGGSGGIYPALEEVLITSEVQQISCSSSTNAYLFYSGMPSVQTYLGWNSTGSPIEGAKYVVIGFDRDYDLSEGAEVTLNGENGSIDLRLSNKVDKVTGKQLSTNDFSTELKNGLLNLLSTINPLYDDLYVADANGFVIFKLDANGAHGVGLGENNYPKLFSNVLYNKRIYSLCDSLGEGTGGVLWQRVVADMCGAKSFVYGNGRELISGGTPTLSDSDWNCGMQRALNLFNNYGPGQVDVIFIENINDMAANLTGSVSDVPFMLKSMLTPDTIYETLSSAKAAQMSVISQTTPAVGTMLRLKYRTNGYKITVSGTVSQTGVLTVAFSDGNSVATASIDSGSSIVTVVNALKSANWVQYGFSVSQSGSDYIIITDVLDRGLNVPTITSLDSGSTGLTMIQAESDTILYFSKCFISYDVSEWNMSEKWVHSSSITLYSQYKGLLEYLQTKFPSAQIYFCIFPRLAYPYNGGTSFRRADGSLDWDAYTPKTEKLYQVQKECCEYMNVEYIDLAHRCGINLYNINAYFPSGNVHPTAAGYEYLGKQLVRILC